MIEPILSKETYAKEGGCRCPLCLSGDLQSLRKVSTDLGIAWQDIYCGGCGAIFRDLYQLDGYEVKKVPLEGDLKKSRKEQGANG